VRGVETTGGRVSAVVTEKGRIACGSVVLAGGAWSRLFCGNLGIELPQLKVLGSVMRTEKLDGGPEISASGGLFGYRKRMDGGYTVATLGVRTIDIVPDSFRLAWQYLPSARLHWQKLRFRVGHRFAEEWRTKRRWALDEPSPFEAVRVLDPAADPYVLERARASIGDAFPAFRSVAVWRKAGAA
jgi:glycine/D-amino acid oxidase-like deaminating enzyme